MGRTVEEFLIERNREHGYSIDREALLDALSCGEVVCRENRKVHRWFLTETVVVKVDEVYIQYTDYVATGDNAWDHIGELFDLDEAKFVKRKERLGMIVYYE